jgi:hypothetical protein
MDNDERRGKPSASGMEVNVLCLGRHNASLAMPDAVKENAEAVHGTNIHQLLADWFGGGTHGIMDESQAETFNSCRKLAQETIDRWAGDWSYHLSVEKRIWSESWGELNQYQYSGQADLIATLADGSGRELILDFKTLYGDHADSPDNLQLRTLAALRYKQNGAKEVTVGIVQPNLSREVSLTKYSESHLEMAAISLTSITELIIDGDERTAGEKQCQYCRAKSSCEEYSKWVRGGEEMPIELRKLPLSALWTPQQWKLFLSREKEVRDWITARKEEAKALLEENPDAIDGYTLSKGSTTVTVNSVPSAYAQLADSISRDAFFEACSVSVTDLANAVATATGCSKDNARKFIIERNEHNITKTEGAKKLVKRKK